MLFQLMKSSGPAGRVHDTFPIGIVPPGRADFDLFGAEGFLGIHNYNFALYSHSEYPFARSFVNGSEIIFFGFGPGKERRGQGE